MPIEAIVGSVLTLLISMKFTKYTDDETRKYIDQRMDALRTELVAKCDEQNAELANKMLVTVSPMAKVLREVKETLGV